MRLSRYNTPCTESYDPKTYDPRTYIKCIEGHWYAYEATDDGQVYSIGSDNPSQGGRWVARATDDGIRYVASPSPTRSAAYQRARRWGEYSGEW